MKLSILCSALYVGSAAAFAPNQNAIFTRTGALNAESSTRSEFLSQLVTGVVAVSVTSFTQPGVANAAKYGSLGVDSPNVGNPKDAIIDDEIFNTSAVQKALKETQTYAGKVGVLKEKLSQDNQIDLGPYIRKEFDFVALRSELNTLNTAFDEDTQRGTDRLIRGIIQDLVEVEVANKQKDGIARSERRAATLLAKLEKVQKAFSDLLAFSS